MKIYKFYSDPGHGWLAVKRVELEELDILYKISTYSYQKGATVYLEEDRDLDIFFTAYKKMYGKVPKYVCKTTDREHPIRYYDSFSIKG